MSTEQPTNEALQVKERNISDSVLAKINAFQSAGQLRLPADYSAENALKSAYLILSETKNKDGQYALQYCTKESIANSLLKMVVYGLSPLKKQCDLIMYGSSLECQIEYAGNIVLAKRYGNLKDIVANAIYKGDSFEFVVDPETGRKKIKKHEQSLESIGSKDVTGAYAVYTLNDGTINVEIMSMVQIRDAWNQGSMKGNSPAHKNFPDEMAKKTVINRACKLLIRGSDDAILYTTEQEEQKDQNVEDVNYEVVSNANKTPIDIAITNNDTATQKEEPKEQLSNNVDFQNQNSNESNVNPVLNSTGPGF